MTEIATMPATTAEEEVAIHVRIEDDATPFVRLLGRTLRDTVRSGHAREAMIRAAGTVVVRSHDTPQVATVRLDHGSIDVNAGVVGEADSVVVVDIHARLASAQESTGDAALAATVVDALHPPLPHWRDAAETFWARTRDIPGIPDVLVAVADGPDKPHEARFGTGPTEYLIAGSADALAGVFCGADDFLASLSAGVAVKGTLAQMSVMTAASWKVRLDV